MSPTVGKVTAKITINAKRDCPAIGSDLSAPTTYSVGYVSSATPNSSAWTKLSSSGWLDYFTNGQNELS